MNGYPFYFRDNTSDVQIIKENLEQSGYQFPPELDPMIILDIGGNIGATALRLSQTYKDAKVFSFEPESINFDIFKKNTVWNPSIQGFNVGLGAETKTAVLKKGEDLRSRGGYTLYEVGAGADHEEVHILNAADALSNLGVTKVDMIKIDTEGAEFDILTTIPKEILSQVQWIAGELHGTKDFEALKYLSEWFDFTFAKSCFGRCFNFHACRKDLITSDIWNRGP